MVEYGKKMTPEQMLEAAKEEGYELSDEELDAMGFYPSYFAAEVDDGTYYPADWRFLWSSKTNTDIALDDDDHGTNGEYRVYMDAITGEVKQVHVIDTEKCIKCGACVSGCPFGAIAEV